MKKERIVLGIGALSCLLLGAGMDRLLIACTQKSPHPEREIRKVSPSRKEAARDEKWVRETARLRSRVTELEDALRQHPSQTKEGSAEKQAKRESVNSHREMMEKMKQENPEQYAEAKSRGEEIRGNILRFERDRMDLLNAVDTSYMTPKQREVHTRVLNALARIGSLREAMMSNGGPGSLSDDQRREFHQTARELRDLYQEEREGLVSTIMESAGISKKEAAVFVEQIQTVYDMTTLHPAGKFRQLQKARKKREKSRP